MSLQVWLPFNNDTRNQGILNISPTFSASNHSIIDNGKIGKCLKTTTSGYIDIPYTPKFNLDSISFGGWFKFNKAEIQSAIGGLNYTSSASAATGNLIGNCSYGGIGLIWVSNNMYSSGKVLSSINVFSFIRTPSISKNTSQKTIDFDKWTHIFYTLNHDKNELRLYVNGELFSAITLSAFSDVVESHLQINKNGIYGGNGPSACIPYCVNDLRIYDHCLSDLEVKQLAQGLVAHYKLDDRFIAKTALINGFGELGTENWANTTNISTTEIPSADTTIKNSTYSGNSTTELFPINVNTTYELSAYLKSTGATSGTTYPSIFPYDADKKMIHVYHCADGCPAEYQTTLAQPLKKGDTVIYATDLSAWTTGDNYYFHVAIFGYRDSFGRLYPDMGYTADSPVFGTKTDKSHIDKTNNTITLNSAFTGENRPAGTVICQATEGGTYIYPFGGIALSSLSNWVLKTTNLTPMSYNRLKYAKYIRWYDYSNIYVAGVKLVDKLYFTNTVYDSSGFQNNGVTWAYDTLGSIEISGNTPRNTLSTLIYSENASTDTASGTRYIYGNCSLKTPECLTVAFWCKPNGGYSNSTTQGQFSLTNNDIGNSAGQDYNTAPMNHRDGTIDINSVATVTTIRPSITFTKDEWHHYAITYDGRYGKVYKDGVLSDTKDMGSNKTLGNMKGIVIGFSRAGGVWRKNRSQYSDFRLYVTALSADDIKDLYQSAGHLDNGGQFHAYEFYEAGTNVSLTKQGQFNLTSFSESFACPYDPNFYDEPDGSTWIRIFHHGDPRDNGLFAQTDTFTSSVYRSFHRWMYMSILNKITNNTYEFMVKQKATYTSTEYKYRWIQSVNPYNAVFGDVDAADVTKITTSGYSTHNNYGGIYLKNSNTYFCANNGTGSSWWGAIGSWTSYNNGIPAYAETAVSTGYYDLYLRIDNQFTDKPSIFKNVIVGNGYKEK